MFKTFFFSEIKVALKQPMVYIFTSLMALMVFGAVSSDSIMIGGSVGNVFENSPYVISMYTTILILFGLLIATAFFNNAALKDYNNNFNEILFATPLTKAGYYFGRFFAALILSTIPMLGVFIGIIAGSIIAPAMGWVDVSRFGPIMYQSFVNNYLLFILPNMFFAGTIIFALANKWRSTVISFVGVMAIIIAYIVSGTFLSDIDNETIAALTDTFGIRAFFVATKYFTPQEKNTVVMGFDGLIVLNRIIWASVGTVVLLLSYRTFSFQEKNKKVKKAKNDNTEEVNTFALPSLNPVFDAKTEWLQFKSFFSVNFYSIIRSVTFKILFIFSAVLLISNVMGGYEAFGLKSYPLTYKLIDSINGSTFLFLVIILVFFSGELIWRDRDNKINEVIDSTTYTSAIALFAKSISLVAVVSVLYFFFILIAIFYQLINGYTNIELNLYFLQFIYSMLPTMIVWSGLMILIQVLVNNKYIGFFVSILVVYVSSLIWNMLDIGSNMVDIASGPSTYYSDMNGFGPGLLGSNWFNLYWVLISIIALQIAAMFWNRGTQSSLKERLQLVNKQTPKSFKLIMYSTVAVWIAVASFVFYNTQILNPYKTSDVREDETVKYEKNYKKYQNYDIPKIADAKYFIDIFPNKRDVYVKAELKYVNTSENPIDSLFYIFDEDWAPEIIIDGLQEVLADKNIGFYIYKLSKTMMPGDTIDAVIKAKFITRGFKNSTGSTSIVKNGTFFNNFDMIPQMGYNPAYEIGDKNKRKKLGLPTKERMPELDSTNTKALAVNYLTNGRADFIDMETVISTSEDQIAVAPGSLIKKWKEGDRNYYKYKVDVASQNFASFVSARYEVKTRKWNGVDIEIYYDEKHSVNVDMMLDAVQRSLEYYTEHFGPYYHKQCRILEFPRYATFAQAFPGTMPYSESFGFVYNLEDESDNNVIDAVIAHEMSHQWWAHQVVGASMQGGTMMSEAFAEYSSLMTMKSITENPMKMRQFLKYDHNRYLRGRSGELKKELPLYKVENQTYIHYGKGSVVLYALQDYIGEDKVNLAMRNFLNEFKYKAPPYPSSYDFMKYLNAEVPDSMKYLIDDWFMNITLYDNRVKEATYTKLDNGKYLVNMEVESRKLRADTIGLETEVPLTEWIDIGAFADEDEDVLMYQKRVRITKKHNTFSFEVDSLPVKAAIDPRHLLIDRIYSDNIKTVKEKG
ncbi:MAG: hypothetical protein B6I18_05435 [Bacteroidetes bacterium 4572_112]|nr:MAG: hypothetical protein B6I18_05435 [Bacteroidetes bacterium 4572_112]